jgi:hypothetical protein
MSRNDRYIKNRRSRLLVAVTETRPDHQLFFGQVDARWRIDMNAAELPCATDRVTREHDPRETHAEMGAELALIRSK